MRHVWFGRPFARGVLIYVKVKPPAREAGEAALECAFLKSSNVFGIQFGSSTQPCRSGSHNGP